MRRRRLLATIGAVGSASTIGAVGAALTVDCSGGTDAPATTRDPPRIDDQACPPSGTDRDGTVCSHTVDTEAAPVYLAASPDSATLADGRPAEEITLTLHNESSTDLVFNPHSWSISRMAATGWDPLEAEWVGDGRLRVPAGDTHTWSFEEAVTAVRPDPALDPGLYATEIGVPDPESDDAWLACIALVRLTRST